MSAVGYAVLPTTISLSGLSKELQKQVLEPTRKAAKQAAETMEKGIGAGAEAAGRAVEKANFRVMKSTQEQEAAESKLAEQKLKTEAANLAVEAAARKRADAETKGVEAVEKAEQELLKKRAAAEKASRDLRTAEAGVEKALSESARAADNLAEKQRLLDAATEDTEESTKGLRERLREVAQEADSTGGMFDGLVGKVGGMATAFAGIAGVGALVAEGMDISGSIDKMNRQLGLTGEAAEMMGDEVTAVMKSGFGTEDAVAAVGSLTSQFAYLGFEGEQTAQELADNFIAFADTFEVDMAEATQTAGQLVKHGLAGDVEHAADLMTTAMQRVPAAMRDELPEIINEYGVNFKNLGYSGEEAFGMLVAQAENGKIALDKTGDALKEFSLFAVDPAKAEVFESIGINATEMANAVAEGGDKAQAKLQETAEKLLAIEDPGLRATTAIELFGTPLEDLGVEGIPSFLEGLSGMESNMAGAAGSSQALADSIGDSLQGRLDTAKNTVMALAGEGFMALWDVMETKVIPAFKDAGEWVQKNEEWLGPLAAAIGGAATAWGLWTAAVKGWELATKVATGVQLAFNAVMNANPIMLVVTALAAVTAGLVYFFTQTETGREMWSNFTTALSDGWNIAVGALTAGWEWLKTTVFDAWTNTVAAVQAHWNLTTNALAFAWAWVKDQFTAVWNTIKTAVFDAWNTYVNNVKSNWDTVTGALSTAWTALKDGLVNTWTTIKTSVFTAFENTMTAFKGFFETIVDGIGTTWNKLRSLLAKPINFMINTVYNDGILRAWNIIADILPGLKTGSPLAGIPEHATGGRIVGPGTGTSDDVLMWGSNGEHMMTALEVKRLGGHGHVYSMREAIRTGRPFVSDGMGGIVVLPQRMDNRAGDLAGAAPGMMLPAFRDGGEIQPLWKQQLAAAHKFAQAQHGKPYQWAGPNGPGSSFDCSGFMGSIAATIQNTNPWQRYWATGSFAGGNTAQGFVPGLGPGFSIGLFNGGPYGGHTAGTLGAVGPHPTVNVESGGSPSMVKYGVGAVGADHGSFTHRYHLPIGADGAFVSGGSGFDFLGSVKKWITDKVSGILDPIKALLPSGPPAWEDIPKSIFDAGTGAFRGFVEDKIANLGHLVSGVWAKITDLFDNGGVLEHGRMAVNRSGKPEIILTNAQWRIFGKAVQALAPATEALNDAARGFQDWARATEEQDRMGYPHEWALHFGAEAAASFADDALSLVGLDGIIGGRLRPSLVNLINTGADNLNDVYGTRFGHIDGSILAPRSILDDEGRAAGTKLTPVEQPPATDVAAAAAGGVDATSTAATVTEPPVKEIIFEVKGDAVTTEKVSEMFDQLNGEIGDAKVRIKKLESGQTASVTSGITGIA